MDKLLHQLLDTFCALLLGLTPAALGAAVSLAYERGLTWGERFIQFAVGIVVSYFATGSVIVIAPKIGWGTLDPFLVQAIGFVMGMIAFKAAPKFIAGASEAVGSIPAALRDRWFARKDGQ